MSSHTGAGSEGVGRGGGGEGGAPFDSKFHFHSKFWINLINTGYHIYPKYSHPLLFTFYFSSTSPFHYL